MGPALPPHTTPSRVSIFRVHPIRQPMPTVTASFDVTAWNESPYDTPDDAPHLARLTVRKIFHGALEATSAGEGLMCQTEPGNLGAGAGYLVSERITGRLDGHDGSFVLQHGGLAGAGTAPRTFGHVVPGSGTGALTGLTGTAELHQGASGHTLTLDYAFAPIP